ncbi:uncharacterized protein [Medicago truncatula]|uniref:uncharacterized protein n=1 Tax=Medicago truncatula TaxID=3880 RepID=UPI0019672085|nr:uncharacterized protein LOC120579961 [Medicago truncatula]
MVNGSPTDEFPFRRGLRQGDPLSPFLFLLAAEGLNVLMKSLVQAQLFIGYSFGVVNPVVVSHLQFAEDTLLLGTKNWANVRALRAALVIFEAMSGLKVNFHKSSLVGVNIAPSWLSEAASVLGCKVDKVPFLYLGMPIEGNSRRLSFWEPIVNRIKAREFGGLGVRRLKEFNLALLGKWCWRMLVDRSGFWYRVLVARYGEVGERWLGSVSFCEQFPRLFDLSENKSITVAGLLSLGVERGGEAWKWRRRWVWLPDPVEGYTVRGSYRLLTTKDVPLRDPATSLIWHNQVLLKVSLFAWRLLHDRLPTKVNLVQRRVLDTEASMCVSDCGMSETAQHLFLTCDAFSSLWPLVRHWLGIIGVDTNVLLDHFFQFVNLTGGGKATRDFLQLIWLLCVWVLWNERNNRLFNNVVTSIPRLVALLTHLVLQELLLVVRRIGVID